MNRRSLTLLLATLPLAAAAPAGLAATGTASSAGAADPLSDAPEGPPPAAAVPVPEAATYAEALARWRSPAELNAWIGARFRYDMQRALQLSETQRQRNGHLPITAPADFFARPSGVCVDLSRFAVETLRAIAPETKPVYLMIEFDPVTLSGQTLRRHWLAGLQDAEGRRWFFADSKRPGHLAGPYADTQAFIAEYAPYRGRRIVSFQERGGYERQLRRRAGRTPQGAGEAASGAASASAPRGD